MSAVKALGGVTVLGGSGFLVAQSWANRELGEEALDRLVSFYSKAVPMVNRNLLPPYHCIMWFRLIVFLHLPADFGVQDTRIQARDYAHLPSVLISSCYGGRGTVAIRTSPC